MAGSCRPARAGRPAPRRARRGPRSRRARARATSAGSIWASAPSTSAAPKECSTRRRHGAEAPAGPGQDGRGQAVGHLPGDGVAAADAPGPQAAGDGGDERLHLGGGEPGGAVDDLAAVGRDRARRASARPRGRPAGGRRGPGSGTQVGRRRAVTAGHHIRAPTNVTPMSGSADGSGVDLALKKEDEEFAASFRAVGSTTPGAPPAFVDLADEVAWGREWQATLAADRWVGVHWPSAYGGRERDTGPGRALPERVRPLAGAAAGEPGRHQPGRPDAAGPRHRGPAPALSAADPLGRGDLVPAVQRARRRERPGLACDPRHAGRRRVPRHRPQGVDVLRPVRHLGAVPGPDRSGRRARPSRASPR